MGNCEVKIQVTGLNAKLLDAIPLEHWTLEDSYAHHYMTNTNIGLWRIKVSTVNILKKRNMTSMLEDESNKELGQCNSQEFCMFCMLSVGKI